jgi:hypothetical protein
MYTNGFLRFLAQLQNNGQNYYLVPVSVPELHLCNTFMKFITKYYYSEEFNGKLM